MPRPLPKTVLNGKGETATKNSKQKISTVHVAAPPPPPPVNVYEEEELDDDDDFGPVNQNSLSKTGAAAAAGKNFTFFECILIFCRDFNLFRAASNHKFFFR